MRLDARIPVLMISPQEPPAPVASSVLLQVLDSPAVPGDQGPGLGWAASHILDAAPFDAGHTPGCACCAGRSTLAVALGGLFAARARAELPLFDTVMLAIPDRLDAVVRRLFRDDPLLAGRFRLLDKSNSTLGNTC